jgi:hypothetical protein
VEVALQMNAMPERARDEFLAVYLDGDLNGFPSSH